MSDASFVEDSLRETARQLFSAPDRHLTHEQLIDLGWEELIVAEPQAAVTALAEEQGRMRGSSRLVELVMARWLPPLHSACEVLAFPLRSDAGSAEIDAIVLSDTASMEVVVVPVSGDAGVVLRRVPRSSLDVESLDGIDPTARWSRVRGSIDALEPAAIVGSWSQASAAGHLALAHELLGVGSAMLDLAVGHVRSRHQFGVPIGTFQAVQHRLADVYVHLETVRAIARTAWIDGEPGACAGALLAARSAFSAANEHCPQVLGAMGCTWEHDMHRFIRRGLLLQVLLDPDATLCDMVTPALLADARVEVLA